VYFIFIKTVFLFYHVLAFTTGTLFGRRRINLSGRCASHRTGSLPQHALLRF
jgi:hypothetical protein